MSLTLCVLLWAQPGAGDALTAYEDRVLDLVPGYGGRVLQRGRTDGADGQPLEIQFLEFPSPAALDDYMNDGLRLSLSDQRDRAIARTQVLHVGMAGGPMTPRLPPNPALTPLAALIGQWKVEVPQFPGQPGRATFEWLEGGAYLRIHSEAPDPAPSATLIVSRDESSGIYTAAHYDSRGVSRLYQMSFTGRIWKMWREAPGFWQRFSGTLSDDGGSIRATWEKSPDGASWEHDFDLIYTKVE